MKERTYSLTPLWKNKPDTITALDEACLRGQNDLVQDLLNLCPDLLYTKNEAGEYSLLFVAYSGSTDTLRILEKLVEYGKNIYSRTTDGKTVLHKACKNGQFDMCKYLVKTYSKLLPILDSGGGSPMHDTGLGGNIKFLELLCSQNFEVQTRSNDDKTILHCACLNGRVNLCRFIIKKVSFFIRDQG